MAASRPQEARYFPSALDIEGSQLDTLTLGTSGVQSEPLDVGVYVIDSDVACSIKIGSTASNVTTATGMPLYANNQIVMFIRQNSRIGGVVASGIGTLRFHKVS